MEAADHKNLACLLNPFLFISKIVPIGQMMNPCTVRIIVNCSEFDHINVYFTYNPLSEKKC